MARPDFEQLNVPTANTTNGTAKVVDRYAGKTLQFHGITTGTYDVEGSVGGANGSFDKIGATVTADGFVTISHTLHRLRIRTVVGQTPAPEVWFGGLDQRSDGA